MLLSFYAYFSNYRRNKAKKFLKARVVGPTSKKFIS